jgi:hypothetical protein
MDETVADMLGTEIGNIVYNKYYGGPTTPQPPPAPGAFDFNKTMHQIRVTVDDMLAKGQIDQAEQYMET